MKVATNDFKVGMKLEVEGQPYILISNEFVKPGKGQPFNRVKLKHLSQSKTIERTFKSGEMVEIADVQEQKVRFSYFDSTGAIFMDEQTYEQLHVSSEKLESIRQWLSEDIEYTAVSYKQDVVFVEPPTFMEMQIVETAVGLRGDSSGRVLKPAKTHTGAAIQVPIFIEADEWVKVDTRTGEYVSRINK